MIHSWPRRVSAMTMFVVLAMPVLAAEWHQGAPQNKAQGAAPQARTLTQENGGVLPAPRNWWKQDSKFNEKLHLTKAQSDEIQRIFDTSMTVLMEKWNELNKQLDKLSKINRPDETLDVITQQVNRVEASRSEANTQRTIMLIKMRRVMNPQQTMIFERLVEESMKEEENRNQGRQDRRPPDQRPADRGRPGF